ncbi:pyridoxamine 5'-phosphate oxidase [Diaminobutyricibacter sp. McL0608]|uniref:pyridoxamine 5'-phosphate oxidase n=1 Tax=Leifsonia sp. McL0608 TaxID=3143537 RepID=UPI0031F2D83C
MADTLTGDDSIALPEFNSPPHDPLALAREWMRRADERGVRESGVAALATVGSDGAHPVPSVRMVLVKEVDRSGLIFTTYASSRKGQELTANPHASVVFYWRETMQQLKVEGVVERLSDAESDRLFAERPRAARATTAVSHQGSRLDSEERLVAEAKRLMDADTEITRPADWAGYRLVPTGIEFWHGRRDRLHRRLAYLLQADGAWQAERLQP